MSITLLLALLAVVAIVAVVLWRRSRDDRRPDPRPAPPQAHPASITVVDAPATPRAPAPAQPFDEDATMVYMRPGQTPKAIAPRKSDEAPSLTLGGVRLVGLSGPQKGRSYPIATTGITLGRSSACDIVLTDSCVSGKHAWIGLVDGKVTLRDLQSTNGTFLNAQLRTSISEAPLRPGDTIFIGGHLGEQFRFEAD